MGSVAEKLRKRRFYPVVIGDETVHVRRLSIDETERLDAIENTLLKAFFMIGCGLLEDGGLPAFSKAADETDTQFSERVKADSRDMGQDTLQEITEAIAKISKTPKAGTTLKN